MSKPSTVANKARFSKIARAFAGLLAVSAAAYVGGKAGLTIPDPIVRAQSDAAVCRALWRGTDLETIRAADPPCAATLGGVRE